MKRIAVIVVGSNSTRMLAADACDALTNPIRERAETKLFLGMSEDLLFSAQAIDHTAQTVKCLKQKAEESGAELLGIYATSASRDAKNSKELSSAIKTATGHDLRILSGEEEAAYSFFGAAGNDLCGVIDIGGGSTEVVLGCGTDIHAAHSLQLGASRLFKMQPINCVSDMEKALEIARKAVKELPDVILRHKDVDRFYLIGGTCTSSARIARYIPEGCFLTRDMIASMLRSMVMTAREERIRMPGFPVSRIDILPAGMTILVAVFDELKIKKAFVTERVNADGLLRAFVHKKYA